MYKIITRVIFVKIIKSMYGIVFRYIILIFVFKSIWLTTAWVPSIYTK